MDSQSCTRLAVASEPVSDRALIAKLKVVRLFLCDVDGVLTDGTVIMGDGKEYKTFNIQDGLGLLLLMRSGTKVGWVSNRPSAVTQQRAEELGISYLLQSKESKVQAIEALLIKEGFDWADVCYLGDDIVDLGALKRAGVSVAVANAIGEAKQLADYVTQARGGAGAVREVARMILSAQGKWKDLVKYFSA
jgi:3-deoxy-D-manno-octulosonate 8-phosphate phosphatase (KDO 8-P phosphatase)